MAIRMPRMAITIISSIRVKPFCIFMVYPLGVELVLHVPRGPAWVPEPLAAVRRRTCKGSVCRSRANCCRPSTNEWICNGIHDTDCHCREIDDALRHFLPFDVT